MTKAEIEKFNSLVQQHKFSEAEALDIMEKDKIIDRGGDPFPLDPELEKGSKAARMADRKPTAYKFQKRERKADTDKGQLVAIVAESLAQLDIIADVTNPEREMEFLFNGRKFKLTLSAPRK